MTESASKTRHHEIVVDQHFPHAPEVVWRTVKTAALMERWLGMPVSDFEPVVGNRFTYKTSPAGDWDGTIRCEVLEFEPEKRFVYSWKGGDAKNEGYGSLLDTVVTLTLAAQDGGTRLQVVHSGFVLPRNETAYRNMSGGWTGVVQRIGTVAGESMPN